MNNKLLLYIDILGFSDLVSESPSKIDDLYEVIASLNVHDHNAFRCVIFSDTILVYNVDGGDSPQDISYLLMFQCEFAKDLMHRLTKRGIVFRAVITNGHFRHYQLNDVPCFYGNALVDAYNAEKKIKAIGLFMSKHLVRYCDIFHHTHFNEDFDFVYITQTLDEIEQLCESGISGMDKYVDGCELNWNAGPELLHLADLCRGARSPLPNPVKCKYLCTIELYRKRYPRILACLEANDLDITTVIPGADWASVILRHPEDCSYAITKRVEF
jgi:hypothetical protein